MGEKPMTSILLESGTNELEIVEFAMGGNFYGINVAKVREIIRYPESIVPVPNAHVSITGVINLRGSIIPIINLPRHLGMANSDNMKTTRIIVCEFNKVEVGFWVDSVNRIHRLSWKEMCAPSDVIAAEKGSVIATVKIDNRLIMILDFEKIVSDISPKSGIQKSSTVDYHAAAVSFDRSQKTVLVAEDSVFIRNLMIEYLKQAGYKTVEKCNGQEALDYLEEVLKQQNGQRIDHCVHLLITDIEMPQIDGLHLVKRIKDDSRMRNLPCIVFSSMVNEELSRKCRAVGATTEISKPDIENLVKLVDAHVIK